MFRGGTWALRTVWMSVLASIWSPGRKSMARAGSRWPLQHSQRSFKQPTVGRCKRYSSCWSTSVTRSSDWNRYTATCETIIRSTDDATCCCPCITCCRRYSSCWHWNSCRAGVICDEMVSHRLEAAYTRTDRPYHRLTRLPKVRSKVGTRTHVARLPDEHVQRARPHSTEAMWAMWLHTNQAKWTKAAKEPTHQEFSKRTPRRWDRAVVRGGRSTIRRRADPSFYPDPRRKHSPQPHERIPRSDNIAGTVRRDHTPLTR